MPLAASHAQDLSPRAYLIGPLGTNAVTMGFGFSDGNVLFDPALPIEDVQGRIHLSTITGYHSLGVLGRSANIAVTLPYSVGSFEGRVFQNRAAVRRSGLHDSVYRFSINLFGGPAMPLKEFMKWRQRTVLGASLRVVAPTGQYDRARLINQGSNRWAFKPELGLSWRRGKWFLDGYGGIWLFTPNRQAFPGASTLEQRPMGSFESHLSYDVRGRLWFSLDANYWIGGRSVLNGDVNLRSLQNNSRIGATGSIPLDRHQSVKISYSTGAYIAFGGDYRTLSVAWQYSWLGTKLR